MREQALKRPPNAGFEPFPLRRSRTMQRIVLCIATLFLFSSFAAGQDDSAGRMEDLVRRCQGNASVRTDATEKLIENTLERGFCFGFFSGILSANAIATGVL